MKARILAFLGALVGTSCSGRATTPTLPEALDHDRLFILDAEDLAEQGIARGYDAVLPTLRRYVSIPATVEEIDHPDSGYYAVRSQGVEYVITGPAHLEQMSSWGRATFALFDIVNRQLQNSPRKFYAVYGGNELGGIFLTEAEFRAARRGTPERRYWPYLPVNEEPDFGAPE